MQRRPMITPFTEGRSEAARLIDSAATPLASVLEPAEEVQPGAFRDAVVAAALDREDVAGVLFAARWGGGGVILT